jgi:transposase
VTRTAKRCHQALGRRLWKRWSGYHRRSLAETAISRLNRGGNRQANAAIYRVVIVRMRAHQPTLDYVSRRTTEGKSKPEIIRCLKRYVAREIFGYLCRPIRPSQTAPAAP